MEPRELLERQVTVVATLGKLVAIATAPNRGMLLGGSPRSLHEALGTFIEHLGETLNCCSVTSWDRGDITSLGHLDFNSLDQFIVILGRWGAILRHHPRAPPLGQALANLQANPEATRADVRAAASTWQVWVDTLMESWTQMAEEATRLCNDWEVVAIRRGRQAEIPRELLDRLVAACDRAIAFPLELQQRLGDILLALTETRESSPGVPEALVAKVAEAEQLWKASALLASCHLMGVLGQIRNILNSFLCGPDGPAAIEVAKRCQKAIEDIPTLLQEQ